MSNLVKLEAPELQGLEKSKAAEIKATFEPMAKMLEEFEAVVLAIQQDAKKGITPEISARAKRARLDIAKIRIDTGKLKDKKKEYIKLEDRAIMGVHNILVYAVKEKEDLLKQIEDFAERQEAARLEALRVDRWAKLSAFREVEPEGLANWSDEDFATFLSGAKSNHELKLQAEKEAEEKRQRELLLDQLENKRKLEIAPYLQFHSGESPELREMEQSIYDTLLTELKQAKVDYDKKQEEIRLENERLEKERKEAAQRRQKRNELLSPFSAFVSDFNKALDASDEDFKAILNQAKMSFDIDKKKIEAENARLEKERKEAAALQAKIKAQEEAEKAAAIAKQKAANAPDKQKLIAYAVALKEVEKPTLTAQMAVDALKEFEGSLEAAFAVLRVKVGKL